ncbi:MAG: hypothetical protein ACI8QS_000201 [Planctomycetota bacterium]|jgi:hypothetical protein
MSVAFESPLGSFVIRDDLLAPYRDELASEEDSTPVRLVYAAAHLVMESEYATVTHCLESPVLAADLTDHIDWDATFALRQRLDSLGFGIAEAMDTAQRFQIGWDNAIRLIEGCGALGLRNGFVAGAGVDHLSTIADEDSLVEGVIFQARAIRTAGGIPILLPLAWLCQQGYQEEDYVRVYGRILSGLETPVFLHWLGEMFLPELAGYFPGASFSRIMADNSAKLRGAKLSLLDASLERRLRSEIAHRDQILLTGDDFNFAGLISGDPPTGNTTIDGRQVPTGEFSHGLLGIFDGIAEPASLALRFLARGNAERYDDLMDPCERLSRHLFGAPTRHYKAGLAFLAWLNGDQGNPMLVQHEERARTPQHYVQAARLASEAGIFRDAELTAERLREFLGSA